MLYEQEIGQVLPFLENFSDALFEWKHEKLYRLSELMEKLEELEEKKSNDPVEMGCIREEIAEISHEIVKIRNELEMSLQKIRNLMQMVTKLNERYLAHKYGRHYVAA